MEIKIPKAISDKPGRKIKIPPVVIYGTVIVIGGYLVFRLIKGIQSTVSGVTYGPSDTKAEMEAELANLEVEGSTLSDGEAIIIAQNLFNAMDRWGTDESAVLDNLALAQTKGDMHLIIKKFGIKPYDGVGLSDTLLSNLMYRQMKNLQGWLRVELSGRSLRNAKGIFDNLGVAF
jgi:hypothetical protein